MERCIQSTALEALLDDAAGRVTGVRVSSSGELLAADAVILASGGFAGDPELVGRHIIGGPGRMRVRAHPRSTGDGFRAALQKGALASAGLDEFYGRNLPAPPADFPPEQFVEVSQLYGRYAVAVNASGERYADEGADWSETALTRATAHQPDCTPGMSSTPVGSKARAGADRERDGRDGKEHGRNRHRGGKPHGACGSGSLHVACPAKPSSEPWRSTTPPSPLVEIFLPRGVVRPRPVSASLRGRKGRAVHNTYGRRSRRGRGLQGAARDGRRAYPWPLRRGGRGRRGLRRRVHQRPRLGPRLRQHCRRVGHRRRTGARCI